MPRLHFKSSAFSSEQCFCSKVAAMGLIWSVGLLAAVLAGCSGSVVAPSQLSQWGGPCQSAPECMSSTCIDGVCVAPAGSTGIGGRCITDSECASSFCYNGKCFEEPGNTLREVGEECLEDSECFSLNCLAFGETQICTEICVETCPAGGLACFEGLCTPANYCPDEGGISAGPGCPGSGCDACDQNATCAQNATGFVCVCNPGFSGDGNSCLVNRCDPNPCKNSGECVPNAADSYDCICLPGFEGLDCEIDVDDCANSPCQNGGSCIDSIGDYSCQCSPGWEGKNCEIDTTLCEPNPCQNAGVCSVVEGAFACSCRPGYAGTLCEINIDNCAPNPCQNGAPCVDGVNTYSCTCLPGYDGRTCETNIDDCASDPCQNGGTCVDQIATHTCVCLDGFSGSNCQVNIDDCAGDPCEEGGLCFDLVDDYFCLCPPGWTGPTCEMNVDDCDPNPCQHGGTCEDVGVHQILCHCAAGYVGTYCEININDCIPNPCQNSGICTDAVDSFTCTCQLGWGGAICDDDTPPCASDDECAEGQFCAGPDCQADVCTPLSRRCLGDSVMRCEPNGSGEIVFMSCLGRGAYFDSTCVTPPAGESACTCEDDWDCPLHTVCEVGLCLGTGQPPSCSLLPESFANVLPAAEITWGGTQADHNAVGSPFASSAQVVQTPLVANLDDDNGDGLIDERDFPEIIFVTFHNSQYTADGVLRAIHGGGTSKGSDFFAVCGTTVWHKGDNVNMACTLSSANVNSTAVFAVGDLDYDGVPEIVTHTERVSNNSAIHIHSNTGVLLSTTASSYNLQGGNAAAAIANLDNQGFAEIVVGRFVFTVGHDVSGKPQIVDVFQGAGSSGSNGQGPISCVADVLGDDRLEVIGGTDIYQLPRPPAGITKRSQCPAPLPAAYTQEEKNFCNGVLTLALDGPRDGFCAIADVWGAQSAARPGRSNPLDGVPELVVMSAGHIWVYRINPGPPASLTVLADINPGLGSNGGAPNVDDFDGDGFPEVGTAAETGYTVIDLQDPVAACPAWATMFPDDATLAPGTNAARTPPAGVCTSNNDCGDNNSGFACNTSMSRCICLHNGWSRSTEDDSSRVTGSSVFDFNGDGAAEVVYNDECKFRVYDGVSSNVLFAEWSESRTRIEYPVVADVDNDGNAEIVFGVSNESGFCGGDGGSSTIQALYNNGLEVWGDARDTWVSARRIWNQHAYHVTNINESGRLPLFEPKGWLANNGRFFNTYRSNPRSFGVAPDLRADSIQVVPAGGGCGTASAEVQIVTKVSNIGDLRVGPGVVVSLWGYWAPSGPWVELLNNVGTPVHGIITNTIEPQQAVFLTVDYDSADNGYFVAPERVQVVVDSQDQERECNESNNQKIVFVAAGDSPRPELALILHPSDACGSAPAPTITTEVQNSGAVAASNIVVRYFAGDPSQGGSALMDYVFAGPVNPGASITQDVLVTPFPSCRVVKIYAVVDADNQIAECNDGNNTASQADPTECCNE